MLPRFTNRNYPYANQDDTFHGRGLHLNMIRDELINTAGISGQADIIGSATVNIVLGKSEDIDAAYLDYKTIFAGIGAIDANPNEVGHLYINKCSDCCYYGCL